MLEIAKFVGDLASEEERERLERLVRRMKWLAA